jgi:hypothetical protein
MSKEFGFSGAGCTRINQSIAGLLHNGRKADGISSANKELEALTGAVNHEPDSGTLTNTVHRQPRSASQHEYSACEVRAFSCTTSRSFWVRARLKPSARFQR